MSWGALAEFARELSREQGHMGGRPRALSEEDIPQVQTPMQNEGISIADICERFGISRA